MVMKKRLIVLNTFKSSSAKDSIDIAFKFSKNIKRNDLILLMGEIGSGKTTFLNGIAKGIGVKKRIISSSFSLIQTYSGKKLSLIHFDFYRINGKFDINEFIEYFNNNNNVVAVEWPYDIERYIGFKPYIVNIKMVGGNNRIIEIKKYE